MTCLNQPGPSVQRPQLTSSNDVNSCGKEQRIGLPTDSVMLGTPHYVLYDSSARIGPRMALLRQSNGCSAIFGFTDKDHYETFRVSSQLSLTPYPLVKRYLQDQIVSSATAIKFVVIDAEGPNQTILHAATMQMVLHALENGRGRVAASYRLTLDRDANVYALDALAVFPNDRVC